MIVLEVGYLGCKIQQGMDAIRTFAASIKGGDSSEQDLQAMSKNANQKIISI